MSAFPEFWLYIRGTGARCEVVCRVFDSQPGWKTGSLPDVKIRTAEGVNGRGLQVVAALADDWGVIELDHTGGKQVWAELALIRTRVM